MGPRGDGVRQTGVVGSPVEELGWQGFGRASAGLPQPGRSSPLATGANLPVVTLGSESATAAQRAGLNAEDERRINVNFRTAVRAFFWGAYRVWP